MMPQWFVVLAYILAGGVVVGALLYAAERIERAIEEQTRE